ncbi:hypothetical protein SAMN04490243_2411 [Robiginitalea myxolifaciens]|uniref:TonB protein C-terminal n=1 Tax=Robiginitalea myxolifaciens TaxID=400055 RepID=A0A1I6H8B6_9FLAO|nr:hypothetical protein [Robiginitalea myxolifaciens]SFR50756.1 hypothetical protein SAMN04490243_2411 [Robiginitalea myxolifaciens]
MRKTSIVLAVALFFGLSATAIAAPTVEENPRTSFLKQIQFLLNQNDISPDAGTLTAKVLFTFDDENRIEVIAVESGHEDLAAFINSQMDGRKVFVDESLQGKRYVLPLRITN